MVDIRIFDEDKGDDNCEFMGRIKLQILNLYTAQKAKRRKQKAEDPASTTYVLKDKQCIGRGQGTITLSIHVKILDKEGR